MDSKVTNNKEIVRVVKPNTRYWENLVQQVLNKKDLKEELLFTEPLKSCKTQSNALVHSSTTLRRKNAVKLCPLGDRFPNVSFTPRETDCMLQLLEGKTLTKTAKMLELSPRTIEFYVNNMKRKLNCRTKSDLIAAVRISDFLHYVKEIRGQATA